MPIRVLAVGNMYPPHHLGGYELVWASAMSHLRRGGHETRVLTTDFHTQAQGGDAPDVFRELRWYWRDHAWPRLSWRERMALERHNQATLERHLRDFSPQVVAWWSMGGMSLSLIERVRRIGLPAVAFVHDDWLDYGPRVDQWMRIFRNRPAFVALAERITGLPARVDLEHAARYLFVSETVRTHARATGLDLAESAIAHSGIDPVFFIPHHDDGWSWRLLYVGRIDERKGVADAVAALAELPGEATLSLVGDGDRQELVRLRQLATELGVGERVSEVAMLPRGRLREVYADADAVLFPVRWEEPWGLVPLEAMAAGTPVIATGRGGSREYLRHGENALLVAPGSPTELAGAVRRLAEDSALRARLRTGGTETAKAHTQGAFERAVLEALDADAVASWLTPQAT